MIFSAFLHLPFEELESVLQTAISNGIQLLGRHRKKKKKTTKSVFYAWGN